MLKTRTEAHLRASGLDWTIIRPGGLGRQPPGRTTVGKAYTAFDPQRRMIWRLFTSR